MASRLGYANSILFDMPAHNIQRLQRVQNALARVVVAGKSHSLYHLIFSQNFTGFPFNKRSLSNFQVWFITIFTTQLLITSHHQGC